MVARDVVLFMIPQNKCSTHNRTTHGLSKSVLELIHNGTLCGICERVQLMFDE
jgi:hypothetical protein